MPYKIQRNTLKRKPIDNRDHAASRGYGSKWAKARKAFLRSHPFCAEHWRLNDMVLATVVDHIVPHKGDARLFWDSDNWQALCATCHNRKTAKEDGGFGR